MALISRSQSAFSVVILGCIATRTVILCSIQFSIQFNSIFLAEHIPNTVHIIMKLYSARPKKSGAYLAWSVNNTIVKENIYLVQTYTNWSMISDFTRIQ